MVKRIFKVRPRINKANGQINISIPKRKMNPKKLKELMEKEEIKLFLEF